MNSLANEPEPERAKPPNQSMARIHDLTWKGKQTVEAITMATSNDDKSTQGSNRAPSADLRSIKGIGQVTEEWLNDALGVFTIENLLAQSVDAIETRAIADDRRISRQDIEDWYAQAAAITESRQQTTPLIESAVLRPTAESDPMKSDQPDWSELAQFVVVYERKVDDDRKTRRTVVRHKTAVHHLEGANGAGDDHVWDGHLEYDALGPWIRRRVEAVVAALPTAMTETSSSRDHTDAGTLHSKPTPSLAEITEVRIWQLPHISTPLRCHRDNHVVPEIIEQGRPVEFELSVELIGRDNAVIEDNLVRCGACLQASNLDTFERKSLIHDAPFQPIADQSDFTLRLSPVTLEPGSYQLDFVTVMDPTIMRQGHFSLPILQVR